MFEATYRSKVVDPLGRMFGNPWVDVLILLMPYIIEMIDKCMESREDFCRRVRAPSDFETWYFEVSTRNNLRRVRAELPQGNKFAAYQIVHATLRAAAEMSDTELGQLYDSRNAA